MRAAFTIAFGWLLLTCVGAAPAAAEINISIFKPGADSLAEGDPLEIAVQVYSPPAEITSMQAAVGARTVTLTKDGVNTWSGSLALTGLPRGQHQLVVTATNAASETQQATRTFIFNNPPRLTVTAPAESYRLSGPDIRVSATCVDDDGPPCEITVRALNLGNTLLATGVGTIDTIVSSFVGPLPLAIVATDAVTRRAVSVVRYIDVLSPRHRVAASYSGRILDITSDLALIFDEGVTPSVVRLVDRATNTSQIIWTAQLHPSLGWYEFVGQGVLTVSGALLETQFGDGSGESPHLREWRGGTLTDLGVVLSTTTRVKGPWATYTRPPSPGQLMLRNLLAGTSTVVTDTWGGDHDIAPDGRVFYKSPSYEIMSFEPGPPPSTTQVTFGSPAWSMDPRTDGINVVFRRLPASHVGPGSLVLRTSHGAEIVLADPAPTREHHVNNGWIAFVRQGAGFAKQLWRRAPDGTERQLAIAADVFILELSDTGEVIFDTAYGAEGWGRYLARPDGTFVDFPHGFKPILLDGAWHVVTASDLLAVDMTVPSRSILAEGATGTFFTTDVAILNPHDTEVPVTIRYLRENAPEIEETRTLPALSRTTIRENSIDGLEHASVSTVVVRDRDRVERAHRRRACDVFRGLAGLVGGTWHINLEDESPELANAAVATRIESYALPIVSERAMYWGTTGAGWREAHNSFGVTQTGLKWGIAEGRAGGTRAYQTFVLVFNPCRDYGTANLRVTFVKEDGTTVVRTFDVAASQRFNIDTSGISELANSNFSTIVESINGVSISVESAIYWSVNGVTWEGGGNTTATRLR